MSVVKVGTWVRINVGSVVRILSDWRLVCAAVAFLVCLSILVTFSPGFMTLPNGSLSERSTPGSDEILTIDLGDHPPESYVERTVHITNPSPVVRTIEHVEKTCACVRHEFSQKTIAPGGSVAIQVQYLTPERRGAFHQTVTLKYFGIDDTTSLRFSGTVGDWVRLESEKIDFGDVREGVQVERSFMVKPRDSWPAEERKVRLSFENAKLEETDVSSDGTIVRYKIGFRPGMVSTPENRTGELILAWNSKPSRIVRIPISAKVMPIWYAEPDTVFFGVVPAGQSRTIQLKLSPADKMHVRADRLRIRHGLGPGVSTEITAGSDENAAIVSVTVDAAKLRVGDVLRGEIEIVDPNRRDKPGLSVPVHAVVQ